MEGTASSGAWQIPVQPTDSLVSEAHVIAARQGREPVAIEGLAVPAKLTELAVDAFEGDVREARSLQHAAVGWLYAIERRGKAREFLWQAQIDGYQATGGKVGLSSHSARRRCEAPLRRADGKDAQELYPEKQHIVPFTFARRIVGKGGTRATASPANAIGNLTWLSHRQNGLDALADRWTVMDRGARWRESGSARYARTGCNRRGLPNRACALRGASRHEVGRKLESGSGEDPVTIRFLLRRQGGMDG